jgi:hypothetical protein
VSGNICANRFSNSQDSPWPVEDLRQGYGKGSQHGNRGHYAHAPGPKAGLSFQLLQKKVFLIIGDF